MKFLLDCSPNKIANRIGDHPDLIAGQLLTPLTRYSRWGGVAAIDNGAFSEFKVNEYRKLLKREKDAGDGVLFVTPPDVVGSARRTLEVFDVWYPELCEWPLALVLQDGIEDLPIAWDLLAAVFVGGSTAFKESKAAADCIKAALAMEKHVHVGRVNTVKRYRKFSELGCHTCDGSGVCRYDWMLDKIAAGATDDNLSLFDKRHGSGSSSGSGIQDGDDGDGLDAKSARAVQAIGTTVG